MANPNVEATAARLGVSNNAAKRAMRRGGRSRPDVLVMRGAPVAGTGKPKGE